MKHLKIIICLLVVTNFNILTANQLPAVNVTNNNYHTNNVTHNATHNATHTVTFTIDFTKMFQSLGDAFSTGRKYISDQYQDSKSFATQKYQDLTVWLKNHKYVFIGAGAATFYSLIVYQLSLGKKVLNDSTNWANWSVNTNFTDLINRPTNLICRELHQAILDKYSNGEQKDALAPIVLFNYDLNQELKTLKSFCAINSKLSSLRIQRLFFTSDYELELAKDKLNRLVYLKKVIHESIQISLTRSPELLELEYVTPPIQTSYMRLVRFIESCKLNFQKNMPNLQIIKD